MKSVSLLLLCLISLAAQPLSANELERLKALCLEQERQIRQLETKVAELSNKPTPPAMNLQASEASTDSHYTVKSGDNIDKIARVTGTSITDICKFNNMKKDTIIHPGQKLKILKKDTSSGLEVTQNTKTGATHTVVAGDTFYKIASKHGVSIDTLISANPRVNQRQLRIGQKIQLSLPGQLEIKKKENIQESKTSTTLPPVDEKADKKPRISEKPILIEQEISYSEFATKYNTTTVRLDEINGYTLEPSTILARGSEIYVPVQP